MKLKKLFKQIPVQAIRGSKEVEISGVCANSKVIAPGNLFIAKRGRTFDGTRFIPEAIAGGAAAIVTDIYDPTIKQTQIIHSDVDGLEGIVASTFYGFPSKKLFIVGVTGTNGKTTSAFLTKHLLDRFLGPCGMIGTIEYGIGQQRYKATLTTPDLCSNQRLLYEMVSKGCRSAVMEVSSHSLIQGRVDPIKFDAAIFTNLTQDHLDYHGTMDNYARAKNLLFRRLEKVGINPIAILNSDSPWSEKIGEGYQGKRLTYGLLQKADIRAEDLILKSTGIEMTVCWQGERVRSHIPLIGRFNIYNCLGVIALGLHLGLPLNDVVECLAAAPRVPGRLEPIANPLDLRLYVDFAHSPDALANVLHCLREIGGRRLIVVFGCGGDRDRSKRPLMAKICEELADLSVVTSDNPRSEKPEKIISEILSGFSKPNRYIVEIDRRQAMARALDEMTSEDILLIAGRGHESHQVFAHHSVAFRDQEVIVQLCQQKNEKH